MAEPKTNKLKTSVDIYNRLLWDDTLDLDKDEIEIIHHVRPSKYLFIIFVNNALYCIQI